MNTVDELVATHGEKYRKLITIWLKFLDENEPEWGVTLNRKMYVQYLIDSLYDPEKDEKHDETDVLPKPSEM
jgi:hypothetical protein